MTLTLGRGPLSRTPPETVNYQIEGPEQRLLFERFPRRIRAVLGGETVVDTTRASLLHETSLLPVLYFPEVDVRTDLLAPTDHSTHCPFKGDAAYWTLSAGGRTAENAVWGYPDPLPAAKWLQGFVAIYWEMMDAWFDEDEQLEGHVRDPYHRVDVREARRNVRVVCQGTVVASTDRPMILSETGLPNRYYIDPEHVRMDVLEPSDTRTVCPYKGTASYWSLDLDGQRIEDVGWSYPNPLEETSRVPGHLSFSHPELEIEEDAE